MQNNKKVKRDRIFEINDPQNPMLMVFPMFSSPNSILFFNFTYFKSSTSVE